MSGNEAKEMEPSADSWVGINEVADHLKIKRDTIYQWLHRKKDFPAHKLGRLWRFKLKEVDEWGTSGGAAGNQRG